MPSPQAFQALAHQPELLTHVRSGAVDDTVADEIVGRACPTNAFRRTATRDFDVHGTTVREVDQVLDWFSSANRDATAFDDPMRVNLARSPIKHLSFGQGGPPVCLGTGLARLDVRVLFQEFAKRIRAIEPAGAQKFLRFNFIGGGKSLPVAVTRHGPFRNASQGRATCLTACGPCSATI